MTVEIHLSQKARTELEAAGILPEEIPQAGKVGDFFGEQVVIRPDDMKLFNDLLDAGEIKVRPHIPEDM